MSEGGEQSQGVGALNQEITDVLEGGVIVLDDNLTIVSWNRWLESSSHLLAASVKGRSIYKIFPELAGSEQAQAMDRALKGEVIVFSHRFHEYFLPLPAPSGFPEVARMQQSARIVPWMRDGKVNGVVVLIQDVTERIVRERHLREALDRAEVANRAKSDFLSSMSHELRTPLNVILGYSDLLADEIGGTLNDGQRTKVERIKTSVWHLLSIIDEILMFSRVEAGKETIRREPVELLAIVRDAVVMMQNEARSRGLGLDAHVTVESVIVNTDARRVRQILYNLLSNALKFTQHGGVNLDLELDEQDVFIHVTDTGSGIDPSQFDDVFEPFTRIEGKDGPTGTGLGLPLSRRLAQLLGGDIKVRSEKGVGSTFTLVLPREYVDPPINWKMGHSPSRRRGTSPGFLPTRAALGTAWKPSLSPEGAPRPVV